MHENERAIRAALGEVLDGDEARADASVSQPSDAMAALLAVLDDDIVAHVPGRHALARDYHGPKDCLEGWLGALVERTGGTLSADVVTVLGGDGWAMGLFVYTASRNGRTHQWRSVSVFQMRDGRIVEEWMHPFDQQALDEFIGP